MAALLGKVGARPAPDSASMARIRSEVRAVWQEEVNREKTRTRPWGYAIAASALLAIAAGWFLLQPQSGQPVSLAVVDHIVDVVEYQDTEGRWRSAAPGQPLSAGAIRTGDQGLATLTTSYGFEIRVAGGSEIEVAATGQVELVDGAVYVDSHGHAANGFLVSTPFGVAKDIGTRFEVRLEPSRWRVQVRDGAVEMRDGDHQAMAHAGERIWISSEDTLARERVAANDPSWSWVAAAAPPFEVEGATLSAFLAWIAHETGESVSFRSEAAEQAAKGTILHGSITGLTPRASLAVVLSTTDFHQVDSEPGAIVIDK